VNAALPLALLAAAWCAAAAGAGVPAVVEIPSRAGQVTFAHAPHAEIGCQDCHHTGVIQGCRHCHTATSTTARTSREAFHGSCIGCHLADLKVGKTTGPAKRCSACHAQDRRAAP